MHIIYNKIESFSLLVLVFLYRNPSLTLFLVWLHLVVLNDKFYQHFCAVNSKNTLEITFFSKHV